MNKKLTFVLLVVVMIISLLATAGPVYSKSYESAITISVVPDKTEVQPGDTISYQVILGPVNNWADCEFTFVIPEGLTYVSATVSDEVAEHFQGGWTESTKRFVIYGGKYTSDTDTLLLTVTCKVEESAIGSNLKVYLNDPFFCDRTGEDYVINGYDEDASLDFDSGNSVAVKESHSHVYDQQVATEAYKATGATCTNAATYYYSCKCGGKGSKTFSYGEALGHADADNSGRCDVCKELMQPAKLATVSISLKGNIAINYYVLLSDKVLADPTAYMQFTMANGQVIQVPVSQGEKKTMSGETYYVFSCAVNAKEMTDQVTGQFFYKGGSTKEHQYSIKAYADLILNTSRDAKLKVLIEAMLNYGAASQLYFGYNTDKLANSGLETPDYSAVSIQGFTVPSNQGTELVKFQSASLILKSETTLRFFFNGKFTATYKGQNLEVVKQGSWYYVDVVGISAKDLGSNVTITISDGTNTTDIVCNPMVYCAAVLKNNTGAFNQELKNTVAALYLYYQAAAAYFGN